MSLIYAGGWVMLPLLLISIAVLALIIDRTLAYIWNPLPEMKARREALEYIKAGEAAKCAELFKEQAWLASFAKDLQNASPMPVYESRLSESIHAASSFMSKRLAILATLGRISPLLGLLGTIIGMIQTFAVVAQSRSGIDMEMLAEGIWQALITTATGLIIAIPAILTYRICISVRDGRTEYLCEVANAAVIEREVKESAKEA